MVVTVVGEVHHALHHHGVDPVLPLAMRELAQGRALGLEREGLAHRLRDERPDRFVLDRLWTGPQGSDVEPEGLKGACRRRVR